MLRCHLQVARAVPARILIQRESRAIAPPPGPPPVAAHPRTRADARRPGCPRRPGTPRAPSAGRPRRSRRSSPRPALSRRAARRRRTASGPAAGPTDQNRIGHDSHCCSAYRVEPSRPVQASPTERPPPRPRRSARWRPPRGAPPPRHQAGVPACATARQSESTGGSPVEGHLFQRQLRRRHATSTAIACSTCARVSRTSIACASAVASCVSACSTSARETMPASYWLWVRVEARSYARNGLIEQGQLGVVGAELKVVRRELGAQAQARALGIGAGRFSGRPA